MNDETKEWAVGKFADAWNEAKGGAKAAPERSRADIESAAAFQAGRAIFATKVIEDLSAFKSGSGKQNDHLAITIEQVERNGFRLEQMSTDYSGTGSGWLDRLIVTLVFRRVR